jgi:hypothetical protein
MAFAILISKPLTTYDLPSPVKMLVETESKSKETADSIERMSGTSKRRPLVMFNLLIIEITHLPVYIDFYLDFIGIYPRLLLFIKTLVLFLDYDIVG